MPIRVCIHGHFYQPPREDPWTGRIERQPSAAPDHDWNARITRECYRPNAAARILDGDRSVSNYARMSFNFGPTLLSYLEAEAPDVYRAILDADRESRRRFGGHGAALAQAYNHTILPLASRRDKRLQVVWGRRDFEHRFGREPAGMWLPETAVDVETLEVLAACGIGFTVLAPWQAAGVRRPGADWTAVGEGSDALDTGRAYRCPLPSGRSIALFFYDGALAAAAAFQDLLEDGARMVERLRAAGAAAHGPHLVHYATDGETYGHHRKFGEMALAFALDRLDTDPDARLTHYAAFLAEHPPTHEARIVERSSWSCPHGVARWSADCPCGSVAEHAGWSRAWRGELRTALDWLHGRLDAVYAERAARLVRDPRAALLESIDLVLDPSQATWARWLERHAAGKLATEAQDELRRLFEMARMAQLMFTSCGWFFEDVSRIETRQVLRYAARAVELARSLDGVDREPQLLRRLERARSNRTERGTAREVYLAARHS